MTMSVQSGIDQVPALRWGTHFSQVFETADDLLETLVPYFAAGLANNECCFWVTGEPFRAVEARAALRRHVPDLDQREARGQITILDVDSWYAPGDPINARDLMDDLLRREADALARGFQGLRTNGNCSWVPADVRDDFHDYEMLVQSTVHGQRMVCMCSYHVDQSDRIMDVMKSHDFVLPPRKARVVRPDPIERELNYRDLLDALPAAIYTTDAEGYLTFYNKAAADLWGYRPVLGQQRWTGTWKIVTDDGAHVPHDDSAMARALRTGKPVHGVELTAERPDGRRTPLSVYPTPLFDDDGKVIGGINLLVDISVRKHAEERSSILLREMNHRANNTLAAVQAIMALTMRHAASLQDFRDGFSQRLRSMSRTHDILKGEGETSATLDLLLMGELAMYVDDVARITLDGPEITLPNSLALPIAMAVHELATNAAKYGAFSRPQGRVVVTWREEAGVIHLVWRETGVPGAAPGKRTGFGSQLLGEFLPRQIGARYSLTYGPDGVEAQLSFPVAEAA